LIAGGALVLILAMVLVVIFVVPALFGGSTSGADVADISSEPTTTWTYDWAGDNNPDFLDDEPDVTPIGESQALVWPVFDVAAYGDAIGTALGWYEGYDQQYDDGYAAGLEFHAADEAYRNDTFPYTVPPANEEAFFPEGAYGNYDEFLGFQDGFTDATEQLGAGANRREKPIDPGYVPAVTLLNAETGTPQWTVDLSQAVDGVDYMSTISAFDIEGSNAIAVIVSLPNSDADAYSLLTLDRADGDTLSSISTPGGFDVASLDGDIIVANSSESGESSEIGRYAVDRLDKEPRWMTETTGVPILSASAGFVIGYGKDTGIVLNGSDGTVAAWGDDINYTIYYQFVGEQLIRTDNSIDPGIYTIQGWDVEGNSTWPDPLTAEAVTVLDGSLFTMDSGGSGFSNLQRADPTDGSEIWRDAYGETFDAFLGVAGNFLLLSRGSSVLVVDLATGRDVQSQKVGDFVDLFTGDRLYYVPAGEELVAYRYTEADPVWSLGLTEGQSVTTVGNHLVLIDADTSTLSGLAAK
jgi:hypothetical protein